MTDPTKAIEIVDVYLQLCEERRFGEAQAYLTEGARLVFPGGRVFTDLPSMAKHGAGRFKRLHKQRAEFVTGTRHGDGATICLSSGTLEGQTLEGSSFSGIRYVDMFVIADDLIHEQHVWNDLAERGVFGLSAGPNVAPSR